MELITINKNEMRQNVYVYFCPETKEGVIIDPGHHFDEVKKSVNENEIKIANVLLTHGHYDHILHAKEAADYFDAKIYCHLEEKEMLETPELNLSTHVSRTLVCFAPDVLLREGDNVPVGKSNLAVIHTPGHTPGSLCFYDETNARLFSGDTLFFESIGRTDFPKSSTKAIIKNVKEKLFTLPPKVAVYPGHGISTTVGYEVANNEIIAWYV